MSARNGQALTDTKGLWVGVTIGILAALSIVASVQAMQSFW